MKPRHHLFLVTALVLAACADDVDEALDTGSTGSESGSGGPTTTVTPTTTITTDPSSSSDPGTSTDPSASESSTSVDPDSSSGGSTGTESGSSSDSGSSDSGSSDSGDSGSSDSSTGEPVDIIVVINELSSNNDGKGGEDPIELYNASEGVADISGWIITDDISEPYDPEIDTEELVFPEGTTLFPGEFFTFYGTGKGLLHPFGLSGSNGDTVRLFDAELATVDTVTYAGDEAAVSYCRMPDGPEGIWTAGCTETFGASNG